MADGDRRFLYFSVRDPGSQSDGNAYETSSLCREVNKGNLGDYYLLADAGYSGSAEVIVPFSGAGLGDRKNQFNFRQVSPYYYISPFHCHSRRRRGSGGGRALDALRDSPH